MSPSTRRIASTLRGLTALLALAAAGCGGDDDATSPAGNTDPAVLVDQQVTVAANGGAADVTFDATANQRVRITLAAQPNTIQGALVPAEPYGHLTAPSGTEGSHPPIGTVSNNQNIEEITLSETGRYSLRVFDGSNAGRRVQVTVRKI
jgi:hypothetical protein